MANRRFTQFYYTLHNKPVQLDCNFVVDAPNGNGLGIRSLKGPGINNVYMHTSATPAAGNPNPEAGIIYVQFQDNYSRYFGGFSGFVSPVTGTPLAVTPGTLTVGNPYTIVSMGNTSAADWVVLGVPVGTVAAVGVTFIAAVTGTGASTGLVEAPSVSGIDHIEVIGDPNQTISSSLGNISGQQSGSYMIMQCLKNGVLTAPNAGTVIGLTFMFSNSSIMVQGE